MLFGSCCDCDTGLMSELKTAACLQLDIVLLNDTYSVLTESKQAGKRNAKRSGIARSVCQSCINLEYLYGSIAYVFEECFV